MDKSLLCSSAARKQGNTKNEFCTLRFVHLVRFNSEHKIWDVYICKCDITQRGLWFLHFLKGVVLWQRVQRPVLYGLKEWLLWLTLDMRTSVTVYNCRHEKYKERVRGETGKRNFSYCHNWLFQPLIFVFFKSRALCSALWRLQNAIFLHFHFLNRGLTAL